MSCLRQWTGEEEVERRRKGGLRRGKRGEGWLRQRGGRRGKEDEREKEKESWFHEEIWNEKG